MERLTIGDLAQASGLSPATIRRYGAAGVLPPDHVDPVSGYRWYSPAQVETALLARTLRALDVPLTEVRAILDEPDATARLARIDRHWATLSREIDVLRGERDHLHRLFGGFQALIDSFDVQVGEVHQVDVLLRRRVARVSEVPPLAEESERRLRARAATEGRTVLGPPVLRYGWPLDRLDDGDPETPREIEVCLPVDGDGDAVLAGGPFVWTEVRGEAAGYPQLLAAYGAVSQWARAAGRVMLDQAREQRITPDHLVVGWVLEPEPTA
jgi:DNA-binding transcriptional MerR regulator